MRYRVQQIKNMQKKDKKKGRRLELKNDQSFVSFIFILKYKIYLSNYNDQNKLE